MNRTTLIVAIAALAVVGIAAGLLLAGQAGPLAGRLAQEPTSINLSISDCSAPDARGFSSFTIAGFLVDSNDLPVADRTVNLVGMFPSSGLSAVEPLVTGRDGRFKVGRTVNASEPSTGDNWQAFFGGDDLYGPSNSEKVYRPC
jgi:hypothetical protein